MSEYRCYEFLALDRPLSQKQQSELRCYSTRAEISPTRFWNEYQWGDLSADPEKLLERYFDAHMFFAVGGTHQIMLRFPKDRIDLKALGPFFVGETAAQLIKKRDCVVIDLSSELEDPGEEDEPGYALDAVAPIRAELLAGDLRPAYLAWLLTVSLEELDASAEEPPVPPGLATLTAAQVEMVDFLRIDPDLVAAAASISAAIADEDRPFRAWLSALSAKEKDDWLQRAADDPGLALGGELLRAFRATNAKPRRSRRRSVGELRALAETARSKRERAAAAHQAKAKAQALAAEQQRLKQLGRDVDGAWRKLTELLDARDYDDAAKLAIDLRDLATRESETLDFVERLGALRRSHVRCRGFWDRWRSANTSGAGEI